MKTDTITQSLRGHRVLAGLTDDRLGQFVAVAQPVEHPKGTVIFREGDPAAFVLFITDGNAALELCAPAVGCRRILTAGPGELLGWSAILGQPAYTATARALDDLRAVKIDTPTLQQIVADDYQIGYELMRNTALTLAKRLRVARLQAADVFGKQVEEAEATKAT
ncbi:MAG: cyclic nucleotide-binding domain-containing protein [Planctomycetota bacterium]